MPYPLPVTLEIGDKLLIEGTGAYTSTYSSVAFNGFPPLKTYPHLIAPRSGPAAPVARFRLPGLQGPIFHPSPQKPAALPPLHLPIGADPRPPIAATC